MTRQEGHMLIMRFGAEAPEIAKAEFDSWPEGALSADEFERRMLAAAKKHFGIEE